jgi:hypothetical protein
VHIFFYHVAKKYRRVLSRPDERKKGGIPLSGGYHPAGVDKTDRRVTATNGEGTFRFDILYQPTYSVRVDPWSG